MVRAWKCMVGFLLAMPASLALAGTPVVVDREQCQQQIAVLTQQLAELQKATSANPMMRKKTERTLKKAQETLEALQGSVATAGTLDDAVARSRMPVADRAVEMHGPGERVGQRMEVRATPGAEAHVEMGAGDARMGGGAQMAVGPGGAQVAVMPGGAQVAVMPGGAQVVAGPGGAQVAVVPGMDTRVVVGPNGEARVVAVGHDTRVVTVPPPAADTRVVVVQQPAPAPVAQPAPVAVAAPVRQAISDANLLQVMNAIRQESFPDEKMRVLESVVPNNWFTVAQTKQLIDLFTYSSNKVHVVEVVAPRLLDKENSYMLYSSFTFSSDKEEVQKILAR